MPSPELRSRRDTFVATIAVVFIVLIGQLFNLQVVRGESFLRLSEENYMRITPIAAPRGEIFDANGRSLVTSRPSFTVFYWFLDADKANETLPRLCGILGIDLAEAQNQVEKYAGRYFEPIPIARDITPEQYTAIAEGAPDLPGVFIEAEPVRYYQSHELAAPVLGYDGVADGVIGPTRVTTGRPALGRLHHRRHRRTARVGVVL